MGVVPGLPVSGSRIPALLHAEVRGSAPWTGGLFGPEASAILPAFILAGAGFYLWRIVVERKLTAPALIVARSATPSVFPSVEPDRD